MQGREREITEEREVGMIGFIPFRTPVRHSRENEDEIEDTELNIPANSNIKCVAIILKANQLSEEGRFMSGNSLDPTSSETTIHKFFEESVAEQLRAGWNFAGAYQSTLFFWKPSIAER